MKIIKTILWLVVFLYDFIISLFGSLVGLIFFDHEENNHHENIVSKKADSLIPFESKSHLREIVNNFNVGVFIFRKDTTFGFYKLPWFFISSLHSLENHREREYLFNKYLHEYANCDDDDEKEDDDLKLIVFEPIKTHMKRILNTSLRNTNQRFGYSGDIPKRRSSVVINSRQIVDKFLDNMILGNNPFAVSSELIIEFAISSLEDQTPEFDPCNLYGPYTDNNSSQSKEVKFLFALKLAFVEAFVLRFDRKTNDLADFAIDRDHSPLLHARLRIIENGQDIDIHYALFQTKNSLVKILSE